MSWRLIVDFCLPIPIVATALLLAPAPRWFTRGVLRLVERTLGLEFFHTFKLLHVMLFISGATFLASTRTTAQLYSSKDSQDPMVQSVPNMLSASLGKRWRAERNFWISFLTFFSWMVLARLYVVVRRLVSLNDEVMALKGGPLPEDKIDTLPADGGAPSAPPKKME